MPEKHGFRRMSRRGFTLLEFLVVIAIICVLLATLLPAVLRARDAARRAQCLNHLRQLGLALYGYHEAHLVFPPGYVARGVIPEDPATAEFGPGFGWQALLLPLLDQGGLSGGIQFEADAVSSMNSSVGANFLTTFVCPQNHDDFVRSVNDGSTIYSLGASSYAGMFGFGDMAASPGKPAGFGTFFRNSRIGLLDLSDGASNTIIVGERTPWLPGMDEFTVPVGGGVWFAAIPGAMRPSRVPEVVEHGPGSWVLGAVARSDRKGRPVPILLNSPDIEAFSSLHPGGAQFLLGDGSARFISDRIDPEIYMLSGQINDGRPMSW